MHTRGAKKAPRLARPWPLLEDGQDPDGLEARVAFHLHRTGFVGARLAASSFLSRPDLQSLAQGRLAISADDVIALARSLGLPPRQLLRSLDADEAACWRFYRTSARHRVHVWRRARACWETAGVSARLAASIMRIRNQSLTQALEDRARGRVLACEPASKLTSALEMPAGPEAFLMFAEAMWPPEHNLEDVVAPLTSAKIDALKNLHLQARPRDGNGRR
jgi:hypothetical protein